MYNICYKVYNKIEYKDKEVRQMGRYPCKDCILKCNCSKICDKVTDSTFFNYYIINKHICPDCGMGLVCISKLSDTFYIMTCTYCYSRFTMEFWTSPIKITRSITPKGMVEGLLYETKSLSIFIEEHERIKQ
jgi:hypothetical protein